MLRAWIRLLLMMVGVGVVDGVAHRFGEDAESTHSHGPFQMVGAVPPDTVLATRSVASEVARASLVSTTFEPFRPKVRTYWDSDFYYVESDGLPDTERMPDLMVGITAWQQQIPLPVSYFAHTTNPERSTASLGFGQPNVWKLPLIPVPATSPIPISSGNFQRGAIALAVNGVPIFNPRNNRGEFSQAIGELDRYGGHCGLADDYHYHLVPVHLQGVVGISRPLAWALDGYAIFGYSEPDGSARKALDGDGGHDLGDIWGYHYHAIGSATSGPEIPYMMNAFHGTVGNVGGQVDPQPEVSPIRQSGTGGYLAQRVPGASIVAFKNPVALKLDEAGHLVEALDGLPSLDQFLMRYAVGGVNYDVCWRFDRSSNPKTTQVTWRLPGSKPVTTSYNSVNNRITAYAMAGPSLLRLPDTGQTLDATIFHGEDSDYTLNPPSFMDNGDGTVSDRVTGLMWQKTDSGEMTWENATSAGRNLRVGGYTDWRLPTPSEAFSILNHNSNPALDPSVFNGPAGAEYFWTSDIYGSDATKVWVINSGGGLGPHPKIETLSAGGSHRFHARFVRGAKPTNGHNYRNEGDGIVTDLDTGLMWIPIVGTNLTWTAALQHVENLTAGGFSDWRLPNVKELQSLVDMSLASGSGGTVLPCLNRTVFPGVRATAYWTSTALRGAKPTQAWLVEFGVTPNVPNASGPARGFQGIVSYEAMTSAYPVFAVRHSASPVIARSVTTGRAETAISNLLSTSVPGSRVSGVGTIRSLDGKTWTVPASTQYTNSARATDLYNEVTGVTPPNLTAVNLATVPIVEVDADGEVVTGYLFADNYFELYANGVLIGVDSVPYTPFNSSVVRFRAKRPIHYAVRLVDWEENLGLGSERNGGNAFHAGDGGFIASFSDGTVTDKRWKAQTFYISPLDNPEQVVERPDGTHDSSAVIAASTLGDKAYALHYPIPEQWFRSDFDDSLWPSASTYTEEEVGVDNKPAYQNFRSIFAGGGSQFIWSSNLVLDNDVLVRFTGPGPLSNATPLFPLLLTNRFILGGGEAFSTTRAALDPDLPTQTLRYGLLAAPLGATIDPSTGLIRWQTRMEDSGTSNRFQVVVNDNGSPSKSATNEFTVFVRSTRPNVVILVTDDHGYHDISAHGGEASTPNLDRLGTDGIRLERFYATPVCSVTRAALLTGRNTIRTAVNNSRGLNLHEHILPQTFKAAGYQTFMCGKWHLGGLYNTETNVLIQGMSVPAVREGREYEPQNRGWDVHYGEYTGAIQYTTHVSQETGQLDWWLNGQPSLDVGWSTDLLADKAIQLLRDRDPSKPVVLYLAFNAVHGPVSAPASYLAKYAHIASTNRRTTLAALDHMDVAIGRVLGAIDTEGMRDSTVVAWFGDNGGQAASGGSNLPLRGDKGDVFDGGIHTPAAVRWPGVLPAGVTNYQQFVWVGDWFPTLCAAAGVTPRNTKPFDGENLWPSLLRAKNGGWDRSEHRRTPLISGSSAGAGIFDVFNDASGAPTVFKLVRDKLGGGGGGFSNALFDIIKDPLETTDLIGTAGYAPIAAALGAAYDAVQPEVYTPYIGVHPLSQSVAVGGSVVLWAMTTVYPKVFTCQWRKNGVEIPGATQAVSVDASVYLTQLNLTNVTLADAGSYDVVVSDRAVGWPTSVVSLPARLDIGARTNAPAVMDLREVTHSPASPTSSDSVWVQARVVSSAPVSEVLLHYTLGPTSSRTNTVFRETMASTPIKPWTGTLCDNPWEVTFAGTNPFEQRSGANSGLGSTNGLEFKGGTTNWADSMVAPTQSFDARGERATVEFWSSSNGLTGDAGWVFQIDAGKGYTTRLSEVNGTNHVYRAFRYDLDPSERVSNLRIRWQFRGGNPAHRIDLDQISLTVASSAATYTTIPMVDDGLHSDGLALDGVFGVSIPPAGNGTTASYYLSGSNAGGAQAFYPGGAPSQTLSYTVRASTGAGFKYDVMLGRPTSTSIAVSVMTQEGRPAWIEYGTEAGRWSNQTAKANLLPDVPWVFELNDLEADVRYYYRVRFESGIGGVGVIGEVRSFRTQRAVDGTFTFVIEADPHHRDNEPEVWQRALTNMIADAPDFLIDLGDTFMDEKVASTNAFYLTLPGIQQLHREVRNEFLSILGHSVPVFLVGGNHDPELGWLLKGTENPAVWGVQARQRYFPGPVAGNFYSGAGEPDPFTHAPRDGYYAFTWGDALFVMLDPFWYTTPKPQQNGWSWTLGSSQYQWLKRTLETSRARYRFVFAHHLIGGGGGQEARGGLAYRNLYEWGGNNLDGSPGFATQRPGWAAPIRELLLANQVQVFFHGHDHLFVKEDDDANGDGIPDLIYQEVPQPSRVLSGTNSAVAYGYTNGVVMGNSGHLRVTVSPEHAIVEYVRVYLAANEGPGKTNRMVSYSYKIRPVGGPSPQPTLRLSASVFSGDVRLEWNAEAGVSYTIERSNDLVSWFAKTVGATNRWIDAGALGAATRQFYRVRR